MKELITDNQVWTLNNDLVMEITKELKETYPKTCKYEMQAFIDRILGTRIRAILCTLTNTAYEDIINIVREKLNVNDLFDNREKYLNN